MADDHPEIPPAPPGDPKSQFLCLTIAGYRRPDRTEEWYQDHMINTHAPLARDLMIKYGIHHTDETRAKVGRLFDNQMSTIIGFDVFSQVVFKSVDQYKQMKEDPWYKEALVFEHEKFADTKRTSITIGWITEFIRDGVAVDGRQEF